MPVALAGLSAVVFLVVRADRAFAHATTSAERAIEDPARAARTIFRPGPAGSPALAVAFRQLAPFLRVRWLTGRVLGVLGVVVAGVVLPRETSSIVAALPVSVLGFAAAFMMLFGPLVVRLDVRREIERLDVLRALPLRGEHVLLAVGAAGIIATSTVQATLLLALSVLLPVRAPAVVRAFSVLLLTWPMVTSLGVAVCQLAALLFPTWVTPSNPRGPRIDAIGGRLVALLGYSGSVALLVLPPAVAALALLQTASALGATHLVGRIFFLLTFYFVGGLELWLLSRVSRWAFDRIE